MEKEVLERLGLSPGEAKAYIALLGLEAASVGPIAKAAGVSRSKIYEILGKLSARGLANQIVTGKKALYRACGPSTLLEIMERKKEDLHNEEKAVRKLIPQLEQLKHPEKRVVELFEKFEGLKSAREELLSSLSKGDTLLVLGAPKAANEKWESWFLDFHSRRIKRGIGMNIIYNSDSREYGKIREKFKLTNVRYLPADFTTPTWFDVFNDKVLMVILPEGEKPYALLIRDKSVAESVRNYFELLWKISKE